MTSTESRLNYVRLQTHIFPAVCVFHIVREHFFYHDKIRRWSLFLSFFLRFLHSIDTHNFILFSICCLLLGGTNSIRTIKLSKRRDNDKQLTIYILCVHTSCEADSRTLKENTQPTSSSSILRHVLLINT